MLDIQYAEIFRELPPEAATALIAMIPIAELRVALPLALTTFQLSTASAIFWSVIGNVIPVIILSYLLGPLNAFLQRHSKLWNRFFSWISARTQKKFEKNSVKYGVSIALMLFVAVPLPITGAWTGTLAAFLFRIPLRRALPAILAGVIIASIIVYVITTGITSIV